MDRQEDRVILLHLRTAITGGRGERTSHAVQVSGHFCFAHSWAGCRLTWEPPPDTSVCAHARYTRAGALALAGHDCGNPWAYCMCIQNAECQRAPGLRPIVASQDSHLALITKPSRIEATRFKKLHRTDSQRIRKSGFLNLVASSFDGHGACTSWPTPQCLAGKNRDRESRLDYCDREISAVARIKSRLLILAIENLERHSARNLLRGISSYGVRHLKTPDATLGMLHTFESR